MRNQVTYTSQGATFDDARIYRYRLWRGWGDVRVVPDYVLWLMLNPSTADEHVLDATLRRCQRFTRDWGYSAFVVANLFALRSRDPKKLMTVADPVGPENDEYIYEAAAYAALIVCGWGGEKIAQPRARAVQQLLVGRPLHCLKVNADQQQSPMHPLFVAASTPVQPYQVIA